MAKYEKEVQAIVEIDVADGSQAISRYVGMSPEEAREWYCTPNMSLDDVLAAVAELYIKIGYDDLSKYDGWADIEPGEVTLRLAYIDTW